jgi:hypothetical protein
MGRRRTRNRTKPEDLLKQSPAIDYEPRGYYGVSMIGQNKPPFTPSVIMAMLTDPRVIYGLWLIKGPILSNAHIAVKCDNEIVRKFLVDLINRFWSNSAVRALKGIDWGYSAAEVKYREVDGYVQFDELNDFYSPDVRVVAHNGEPVGVYVKSGQDSKEFYLGAPKVMMHVHWRERNKWYGLSRLYGAHVPWYEIWSDGGFRDIRRLWYYKNSYEGGTMRHPVGFTRGINGEMKNNRDVARELVEKKRAGGVLTIPNTPAGDQGGFAWEYEPPTAAAPPQGLIEYGKDLKDEILEAIGIPPEVISSGGDQGFGSSTGRQVPQMAFYSTLQELFQWLVYDLDYWIARPLVEINFGPGIQYELNLFKLWEDVNNGGNTFSPENFNGNQFQDENQRALPPNQQKQEFSMSLNPPREVAVGIIPTKS